MSDILVEFAPGPVEFEAQQGVAAFDFSREDLGRKSSEAIDDAMDAVRGVAEKFAKALDSVQGVAPAKAQVEFGVKLTAAAGVLLAKAGGEAHMTVTLSWERKS